MSLRNAGNIAMIICSIVLFRMFFLNGVAVAAQNKSSESSQILIGKVYKEVIKKRRRAVSAGSDNLPQQEQIIAEKTEEGRDFGNKLKLLFASFGLVFFLKKLFDTLEVKVPAPTPVPIDIPPSGRKFLALSILRI